MPYDRWHKSRPKPGRGPRAREPWHLVAPGGCPGAMTAQPEITPRDLRTKSKEIVDAVQSGQSFTVTRDGHRIGELIPLRRRRRFVPRGEFAAMSRTAPDVSLDVFRADQGATAEQEPDDPYAR